MAGASIFLVACTSGTGDDVPDDRQFANDPAPTRAATELATPRPMTVAEEAPRRQPGPSPDDLLSPRGAPSTLYTVSDGSLFALHPEDKNVTQQSIAMPESAEVLGLASSPTGDRVAVALRADDGGILVAFFGSDGAPLGAFSLSAAVGATPSASPVATLVATPAGSAADGALALSWQPQGNGVLVVDGGELYAVDTEQGPERIQAPGVSGTILAAEASPTGGQILVHTMVDDGSHRVYLIQRATGQVDELFAMRTGQGMVLAEVTWLPTGKGVLFVEGERADGYPMRGQLFLYRFRDEAPHLLATSGQGGPSASIRHVAVSPDGAAVAYEIAVRDIDQWSTHSLWVRPLRDDAAALQLPVESGHTITGLAWSPEGLTWQFTSRYGAEGAFVGVIGRNGDAETIVEVGATGSATPVASPVASPGASPVAGPGATPIASPVATPIR